MKINRLLYIFPVLCSVLYSGCKKEDQTRLQAGWTSKDPIAIPFNVRNSERELGNLVPNPSFETGKLYYEESNRNSYDLNGWKNVGTNISWINATSEEYSSFEVYNGNHSVKIERSNADETENMGDGIISDFIKVIPGNYRFKVHLKLEDVCPNQARIGTKMYDAVNIRLLYFDKNRLPLQGVEHNPFSNKKIDNTFKSLTLSNFWHIDQFGWGEVHGRSANYPFFDGDLPDEARYVKIFIGLKGTGKMWIDGVDFHYTEDNFTMLERLTPYFDSSYLAYDLVYPKPQYIEIAEKLPFYNKDSAIYPVIVIPHKKDNYYKIAEELKFNLSNLIKTYNDSLNPEIKILTVRDKIPTKASQMVISIGDTELYQNSQADFSDSILTKRKNSYCIHQHKFENLVFIKASDNESYYYAMNTILQLFNAEKSIYYGANITDYPDFLERAYLVQNDRIDEVDIYHKVERFNQFKLNHLYTEWLSDTEENKLNNLTGLINHKRSVMIDLVKLNKVEKLKLKNLLQNKGREIFNQPLNSLLLMANNSEVDYGCNAEQITFISNENVHSNLEFNHIQIINEFSDYISNNGMQTHVEFMAPWNNLEIIDMGHGKAQFYYYDLNRSVPLDMSVYWTGGTYCTSSIDYAEFYRMSKITDRDPILMDNSLAENEMRFKTEYEKNFYAGKMRVLSLFEPYRLNTFNDLYQKSGQRKILLNIVDFSELNAIRILTAADYFWNTEQYNPEKSLWIILNKLIGTQNAIDLIYFNDAYFGLKEICRKIEINGLQYKNTRIAKNFESQLQEYFNKLDKGLTNRFLLGELEKQMSDLLLRYRELTTSVK